MKKVRAEGAITSQRVSHNMERMAHGIARVGTVAVAGLAVALGGISGLAVRQAAEFETLRVSMNALNGSVEEGARNFERLKEFSAETPFQLKDLADAQNMLQGFGMSADNAFESMKMIGDIAAITGADISGIGIAFGQAAAEGRLMTRDIRQLINQGVPAIKLLADTMGVAQSEVLDLASQGRISFDILQQSFREATSAGGMFANGMKRQAKSLNGSFSTLKDNVSIALGEFGNLVVESTDLKGIMRDLSREMKGLTDSLKEANSPTSTLRDTFRGLYVILRELPSIVGDVNEKFINLNKTIVGVQTGGLSVLLDRLTSKFGEMIQKVGQADRFTQLLREEFERFGEALDYVSESNIDRKLDNIVKKTKEASDNTKELSFTNEQVLESYNRLKPAVDNIPPTDKIFDPSTPERYSEEINKIAEKSINVSGLSHRLQQVKESTEKATSASRLFAYTLADGLEDVLFRAQSVGDAIDGIIRKLGSRALTAGIFSLFGVGGGFASNFFGGFRAKGGSVSPGKSYVVGENGPEMFSPNTSGSIIPNGAGMQTIQVHVNGTFRQKGTDLEAVVREVQRQQGRLG